MPLRIRHKSCSRWPRLTTAIVSLYVALCPILSLSPAHSSEIVVATYEGVINPVAAEYLHDALTFAQTSGAHALILKLDTPGGLDTSMRLMIKDMTASTTPVIVYVAPSGGRAASAGVFLTMARPCRCDGPRN
ncbi:hypothetical protein [Nitrospira sp. BLG_1]|uniref:hypothetical protein n=1 Tax=Nitrospira sp. BLG_1 TaxID=3395883 RepID=UPI0039BC250A